MFKEPEKDLVRTRDNPDGVEVWDFKEQGMREGKF